MARLLQSKPPSPCVRISIVRRVNMRILAATLALAFVAGSAAASQVDFQPAPLNSGAAPYREFNANKASHESNGPNPPRRPRREPDHSDDVRPAANARDWAHARPGA